MNQIRYFKNIGLLHCSQCNELKKQCKCNRCTQSIHYSHLVDMMFEIKPEWIKNGVFKVK